MNTDIVVFGVGRVGTSIFDKLAEELPGRVVGVDTDESKVEEHTAAGRNVILGDGTHPDFWNRAPGLFNQLNWIILALPSHQANCSAAQRLKENNFRGRIAATTRYPDEEQPLREHGG